jgi:hypothetical protein
MKLFLSFFYDKKKWIIYSRILYEWKYRSRKSGGNSFFLSEMNINSSYNVRLP